MDRTRLLPLQLPSVNAYHVNSTVKPTFVRRFAVGFIILSGLLLLYVPAYHLVQGPYNGLGETAVQVTTVGSRQLVATVAPLDGWGPKVSRDIGSYIHPDNVTTILNPKIICNEAIYLLIVVCSAVSNFNARSSIRHTWASADSLETFYNSTVKVVFLIGHSKNKTLNNYVVQESEAYNDIIQENFHDTYNNLTLKSVMLLKWMKLNCNNLTYIMKTDDDMYIQVPSLIKTLKARSESENTLLGALICKAKPILDPKNKWYTPKYMFSEKTYPKYLSGTGYVMSFDVAIKLYKAAIDTPLIHLEDVYLTGICARRAKIQPVNHPGFSFVQRKLDACSLKDFITAHKVNASNMYVIWNKLKATNVSCNTINKHSNRTRISARHIRLHVIKNKANKCV